ncbi:MAG: peptidylprolyl isomerase [Nitrospirae bacterium]|nr:MAG: peptidylprolyl isomerase [Nitrospirota bacterium]
MGSGTRSQKRKGLDARLASLLQCISVSTPLSFKRKNPKVVISTKFGQIEIRFFSDVAPRHVENFLNLAKLKFYDGTTFHRVIPDFIIQGGDPLSKNPDRSLHGTGGPGYSLPPELSDRPHRRGTVSMAKMPRTADRTRDVSDNGSQFFICVEDNSSLDRTYTAFGKVVRGMETVDAIARVPRDEHDNPLDPIPMTVVVVEE